MTLPITVATATILVMFLGVLVLLRRLGHERQVLPVTTDWMNELSTDRYRPMLRLLDPTDFQYLLAQKGSNPEMARRLRRQRVQAFLEYLHLLQADFDRVATALRLILAHSAYDRPELASRLVQCPLQFAFGMMCIHFRLVLFRFGLSGVDGSRLLVLFDGMRVELRTLVPDASLAAA